MRVVMDLELESALQKVLSSAFSMRGSVFISYDNQHSMFEAPGKIMAVCRYIINCVYCFQPIRRSLASRSYLPRALLLLVTLAP